MNSSKSWTTRSILATLSMGALSMGALGIGAFGAGCTLTTGTVDDSNGGPGTRTPTGDDDDDDTDADAGTADAEAPISTCEGNVNQDFVFVSATCQACLDTSCCSQLNGCFNLDPGKDESGEPNATCSEYGQYYADCSATCDTENPNDDEGFNKCIDEQCRIAAGNPAIADAWDQILTCAANSCASECGE